MTRRALTIRGIPDDVLGRLRARATEQHRSLNGEVLAILTRAADRAPDAAGHDAGATRAEAVRETAPVYGPAASVSMLDDIDRDALAAACRLHDIRWLAVFGSHARGDARPESDVDVVVDFEPGSTPGLGIIRVADALRPVFGGRRVDLFTRRGLAPRLRDDILAGARELYAA
jgi:uncharacterized protein